MSRVDGPAGAAWTFLFAHGAGAGMDSPFMAEIARHLAAGGIRVVRFEFPYMQDSRLTGGRRPPNPMPVLQQSFRSTIEELRVQGVGKLAIGGKSMGGRVASMLADEVGADALVCLGYPFHPAGKPASLRIDHLKHLDCPTLILQGERDAMGGREEVTGYELDPRIQLQWLADGDHSFKPRKASGWTEAGHLQSAADTVVSFLDGLHGSR